MGLALDEPGESDETASVGGVTFMLGDDMLRMLPPGSQLAIDHQKYRGTYSVNVVGHRSTC